MLKAGEVVELLMLVHGEPPSGSAAPLTAETCLSNASAHRKLLPGRHRGAVEALHRSLRKIIKTRGSFPNDEAALKLLYLAIKNAGLRWHPAVQWTAAMGQFAIQFGER